MIPLHAHLLNLSRLLSPPVLGIPGVRVCGNQVPCLVENLCREPGLEEAIAAGLQGLGSGEDGRSPIGGRWEIRQRVQHQVLLRGWWVNALILEMRP